MTNKNLKDLLFYIPCVALTIQFFMKFGLIAGSVMIFACTVLSYSVMSIDGDLYIEDKNKRVKSAIFCGIFGGYLFIPFQVINFIMLRYEK